jgi:carboxyl-terminal processing protease
MLSDANSSFNAINYFRALKISNNILQKDSLSFEALRIRGSSYFYLNNLDSAYYDLLKYSNHKNLDNSFFKVWISLKNYFEINNDFKKALECSKQAIKINPSAKKLSQFDHYSVASNKQLAFSLGGKAIILTNILDEQHIQPITKDSNYVKNIITNYINLLDPIHEYFLQEDIDEILVLSQYLRSDIRNSSNLIFEKTLHILNQRLNQVDSILSSIVNNDDTLNFNKIEKLEYFKDRLSSFPTNIIDLTNVTRKMVKFHILKEIFIQKIDSIQNLNTAYAEYLSKRTELTKKVVYRSKQLIKDKYNYHGGIANLIQSSFLKSIASVYDPHSDYFTNDELSKFEELLSKEEKSLGLTLKYDINEVKIESILFGSPAWISGNFEENDIVVKIKPKNKEPINIDYYDAHELNNLLYDFENESFEFTLRKKDGRLIDIDLTKTKIPSNNFVRSFILDGKRKIGYAYIPSFYVSSESFQMGCDIDLMNEIVKLENENTEGLILDLRDNGGGSVFELEYILSMFLKKGQFGILSKKNSTKVILEKVPTGICYEKPLLVLINENSASASELLAAILQFNNRALIIGAKSFGKFSGQIISPLIPRKVYLSGEEIDSLGYAKVTNIKMYLANGTSYQKDGITPDIPLPFILDNQSSFESKFKNALSSDTTSPLDSIFQNNKLPISTILIKSEKRIENDMSFNMIKELSEEFRSLFTSQKEIILQFENFKNDSKHYSSFYKKMNLLNEYTTSFKIKNHNSDLLKFSDEKVQLEINKQVLKTLRSDFYLNESFMIINDLIDLQLE